MKGWMVSTDTSEGAVIVFADNRNKAKVKALDSDGLEDYRYIDLIARRVPKIDGMENCEPRDNYWQNNEIRLIMVKEYAWACIETDGNECDKCVARKYCLYDCD